MIINDDILNKYIDGDLSQSEMILVKNKLKTSENLMKKYKTLLLVHNRLKNMKEDKVSDNFTPVIMSRISKKIKFRKSDKYFIFSISSVFVLVGLIITGFILANILSSSANGNESIQILESIFTYSEKAVKLVSSFFSGKNVSLFGSIISLGIILSAYFFYDFNKSMRKNLK